MRLSEFQPENELEFAILDAKQGMCSIDNLMKTVCESDLYVPSKIEVMQDGSGFDPLLLGEIGNPLVAACTSFSRLGLHRNIAEFALQMKGRDFFLRLPKGYGVVLNPGYIAQLIVLPDAMADISANLKHEKM
jgi:hypothetical protein